MSEKFIIGITGNIATGKSVVKKMLENLGAYTIDADNVANSALAKGAPAYKETISQFGNEILGIDGEVDRKKLGEIVFNDPKKLKKLEDILHPLVQKAVQFLINRSSKQVIAIEAIKLLESPLREQCDSIWVVSSDVDTQINRLELNRDMNEAEAKARLANQSSQKEKIRHANVIIQNDATLVDTWKQVLAAWIVTVINRRIEIKEHPSELIEDKKKKLHVVHAMPKHAGYVAKFLNEIRPTNEILEDLDVLERFGDKAYYLLMEEEQIIGLIGWQVEDLVAQVDEIHFRKKEGQIKGLRLLFEDLESSSEILNTEVIYVKISEDLSKKTVWRDLGYELIELDEIKVNIWKKAARKLIEEKHDLMFKELKSERVLLPI